MAAAAHLYRPAYDWSYQTISVLLNSEKDPEGYLLAWAGLQLAGFAGVVWTFDLCPPVQATGGRPNVSFRLLQTGFLCMACAVIPQRLLPWTKGHQAFAILSFLTLCSGVTSEMFHIARQSHGGSRLKVIALTALPLIPCAFAGSTQAYLNLFHPDFPWVTPDWRVLGISRFLSFGLWEWLTSAVFSACFLMIWHSRRNLDSEHT
jgi:hypothetical protein